MKKEYNLSKMKWRKNLYASRLKKQITIRLSINAIKYFKSMAESLGIPYQHLINSYLVDCARSKRKPITKWAV